MGALSKNRAAKHEDLLKNIRAICLKNAIPEPDEFLAEIMAGIDPRFATSPLYDLVTSVAHEQRQPTPDEWSAVVEFVSENPAMKFSRVDLQISLAAAHKLFEHLHPKPKSLEITGEIEPIVRTLPLTEDELRAQKKVFDEHY